MMVDTKKDFQKKKDREKQEITGKSKKGQEGWGEKSTYVIAS